jgi:hypothetical protein
MSEKTSTSAPKTEAKKEAPVPAKTSTTTPVEKSEEVCRAFRNTGQCRFAGDCKYVHSEGDPIEPPPRDYTPRGECHNYRDNKECRFAERCRFQHGEEDKRATYRPERKKEEGTTATGTDGETQQICRNFQRRGKCRFADKCRHIHVAGDRKEAPKTEKKAPETEKKTAKKESGKKEQKKDASEGEGKRRRRNRGKKEEKGEKLVLSEENKWDAEGVELCRNFRNKGGKCRFGDDCNFSHAPGGPIGQPAGDRPQRESRGGGGGGGGAARVPGLCYNFRDDGSCEFGDECRFKHGDSDNRDFSTRRTTRKAPGKRTTGVCYQFQESGTCDYEGECRFSHDAAE